MPIGRATHSLRQTNNISIDENSIEIMYEKIRMAFIVEAIGHFLFPTSNYVYGSLKDLLHDMNLWAPLVVRFLFFYQIEVKI